MSHFPGALLIMHRASLSLPQLGTQTTEKRGVRWEQEEPGDSFPGKRNHEVISSTPFTHLPIHHDLHPDPLSTNTV